MPKKTRIGGYKVRWATGPVVVVGLPPNRWDTETAFQIYAVTWLRKQAIRTGNPYYEWWHHSANERSNGREGFIAKLGGQSKGFPDLIHVGLKLAIELKVGTGRPSPEQLRWLEYLEELGWKVAIVFTFEQFIAVVEDRIKECTGNP